MKTVISILVITFCTTILAFGQEAQVIVYLKNGDIYKGQIVKDVPGEYLQMELKDGSTKKFTYSEIDHKETENVSYKDRKKLIQRKTSFGVKGGMNQSSMLDESTSSYSGGSYAYDFKSGMVFGGFLNIPVSSKMSIQPELLYSEHGGKYVSDGVDNTIIHNLLLIPVLFLMEMPAGKKTKFNVYPGLGFAFSMSSFLSSNGREVDISEVMNAMSIFGVVGLSLDTKISTDMSLIFDARVNVSYSSMVKSSDYTEKDISFSFMVGLGF